uniref:BHLH domain-containing protein n=1 Tax=Panagrellus redivivus TaxID=6233 RepID=A0A7E4ULH6_PANRE
MSKDAVQSKEPIHSGHFMISNPHEVKQDEDDEDFEVDVVDVDDSMTNTTPNAAIQRVSKTFQDEKPVTFYTFGREKTQSIAIDVSLNQLKKCINVAYMKLTTPKWKDFKGLKLQWKHRIRLNNVIWRAYYMEFRKPDKKKKHCYFTVPDDDTTHTKIEGSVLEGMYWKRRMDAVCAQYKRWRTYNRPAKKTPKSCCRKRESSCTCNDLFPTRPAQSRTPQNLSTYDDFFVDDDFDNEFTNSLFESLDGPFIFPNPKEIGSEQMVNADIMQPCLVSLQPSLDEIMGVDMDMQQHHQHHLMMPQHHLNSGLHHEMYRQNHNINNMPMYRRQQQPPRQTPPLSSHPLISTQVSQPLYSRAIYECILPVQGSPQSFPDDPSGRASSAISFGAATPQPMSSSCMPPHMITVSGGTMMASAPPPIMSNVPPSNQFTSHDVLRQRMAMENNQLLHNQQQQQQQNWLHQQYMQQLNERNRAIQMLQSPGSPMTNFSSVNNNMQFNAQSPFFNLQSPSPNPNSLTNMLNQNLMTPSPNMHNGQTLSVPRYLATNNVLMQQQQQPQQQQPQQPTALPGLMTKPNNGIPDYANEQNAFAPVKLEPKFHHQHIPESPASGDVYRALPNPASVGPSTSATVPPAAGFPPTPNGNTVAAPAAQLYRSASVGDAPVIQAPHQAPPFVPPTSARYAGSKKRPHPETSSRSSPSYAQAASTSSSEMMLSDSEPSAAGDDKEDTPSRSKRRTTLSRTEVDDSLQPEERKRILHLNAEKNRRNALKDGFEMLVSVIPAIEEAGIKPTNAVVLNRAGQHIRTLRSESERYKEEIIKFKEKIERADARISMLQSNLPNTTRSQSTSNANMSTQIEQAFERHVRERSREDYRFWLMAHMLKPLIQTYAKTVHTDSSSRGDVIATTQSWLAKQWNVTELRPLASKMLVFLATDVNVLKNSAALPEHVRKEINKTT